MFDGLPGRVEVDFSPSNETYNGNWRWWVDHETGIRFYEACLGTAKLACDAHHWVHTGLKSAVFLSLLGDLQLQHATTYFLTVRATDNAGHSTSASSDGVTIDLTPPLTNGVVEHGLWSTHVRKYTNRRDLVLMRWRGIRDLEVCALWSAVAYLCACGPWLGRASVTMRLMLSRDRVESSNSNTGWDVALNSTTVVSPTWFRSWQSGLVTKLQWLTLKWNTHTCTTAPCARWYVLLHAHLLCLELLALVCDPELFVASRISLPLRGHRMELACGRLHGRRELW